MAGNLKNQKKKWASFEVEVTLPEAVKAEYDFGILKISGPKGEVSKNLRFPNVYLKVESGKVLIGSKRFTKSEKKIIFTYRAHVNNMIKGVTEGFVYKLAVVYAKFPMTVELKGNLFTVKNFLGEKVPRSCEISNDVKVEIKGGKEIEVQGIDKEKVGQTAANIEQLTRISHLDRRVVQDGIFITEKPHRRYV